MRRADRRAERSDTGDAQPPRYGPRRPSVIGGARLAAGPGTAPACGTPGSGDGSRSLVVSAVFTGPTSGGDALGARVGSGDKLQPPDESSLDIEYVIH